MIQSLLVANRGEIACRVIRTAKRMGIRTVAVYSDADAKALHVREADEAVHIGPSPPRESYLVGERIIAAAKSSGAEAIHPGYGFLSENADFAQAVIDAGLVWVGPKPESIRAMGLKDAAKARMIAAGVPVTPGYLGEDQSDERLQAEADQIGYPVLIKAVAGGGGKGMRRVDAAQQFPEMLQSCRREAAAAFGDDRVLIEKYILSPRHIEVQVFGDTHGNIVHLFERDCSLQRRHQKVIEEAPAPGMTIPARRALCEAAIKAARAVDYVGAGTVEFIADATNGLWPDRVWFMEMNTRLQVEHPVTEEITGIDLVEWQLRVASGEPLPRKQEAIEINGHAIEARIYAEDPSNGFLPATGTIEEMRLGSWNTREETGVEEGDKVTAFYDPMIAKIIVHRDERHEAIDALRDDIDKSYLGPITTNMGFLYRLLGDQHFRAGVVDTGLIERTLDLYAPRPAPDPERVPGEALWLLGRDGPTAWERYSGFRLNAPPHRQFAVVDQFGGRHAVDLAAFGPTLSLDHGPAAEAVYYEGGERFVLRLPRGGGAEGPASDGAILAPMPGRITAVDVAAGATVTAGQRLVTMEAMKMEHSLIAPFDGAIAELNAEPGAQVTEGMLLVKVERAPQSPPSP